jgi:MFS family permease
MFKEISDLRHFRNFSKVILPISVAFFIYTFGWGVVSPMFSIFVNNITKSVFVTGVILSITTLFGVFLNIPFMVVIDRFNMKRVLQLVLLAYVGFALLYPIANNTLSLVLVSIGRGIASSFLWLTSWSYVFNFANKKVRGKESGFFSSMNDFASGVAPLIGGFTTLVAFLFPFYILAMTSFVAFIVVSLFVHNSPRIKKAPLRSQFTALLRNMKKLNFLKTMLLVVTFYALINIFYSFIAIFLNFEGMSIFYIGIILTAALLPAVALEVPIGNLVDKHGVRKVLSLAAIFTAATGIMFTLSSNIFYVITFILTFTIAYTTIFIALYSRMSDLIKKEGITLMGSIATIKDLGYTIGPLMGGWLIGAISIGPAFMVVGAAFMVLAPIALTLHD